MALLTIIEYICTVLVMKHNRRNAEHAINIKIRQ